MAEEPERIWRGDEPPPGPAHVCFSGGRTSAYMLFLLLRAHGGTLPPDWRVVFANTGLEMPPTLDFVREVGDRWDIAIDWIEYVPKPPLFRVVDFDSASRKGEPFEKLIDKKGRLPSPRSRFCTEELKVLSTKRFLVSEGWSRWTQILGIRADEPKRVHPARDRRWMTWHPLVRGGVTVAEVGEFWSRQNFDLRLPNIGGKNWLGNCDGCFLKSEQSNGRLALRYPDRAKWWERQEAKISERKGRPTTFSMRGESRRALREFVEEQRDRQRDWIVDLPPGESPLCGAEFGDCTG